MTVSRVSLKWDWYECFGGFNKVNDVIGIVKLDQAPCTPPASFHQTAFDPRCRRDHSPVTA